MKKQTIHYARQLIDALDIRAVTQVLKSDLLTQVPEIEAFERDFAKICSAKGVVVCSFATEGLHLSAMELGMGPELKVKCFKIASKYLAESRIS